MVDSISALEIEKRSDAGEKNYKVSEAHYYSVSNVVGMNVNDAKKVLDKFSLEFSGSGSIVSYQSPGEGERILEGDVVRLYLSEE